MLSNKHALFAVGNLATVFLYDLKQVLLVHLFLCLYTILLLNERNTSFSIVVNYSQMLNSVQRLLEIFS